MREKRFIGPDLNSKRAGVGGREVFAGWIEGNVCASGRESECVDEMTGGKVKDAYHAVHG